MTLRQAVEIIEKGSHLSYFRRSRPEFHVAHKTIMGTYRRCAGRRFFTFAGALSFAKMKVKNNGNSRSV